MSRIQGVDALRTVAIIAVIAIHTTPLQTESMPIGNSLDFATAINQAARFAVPFFFVVAGYFWAQKFKSETEVFEPTAKMAKRIAFLLVAWSVIYLLPTNLFDALALGLIGPVKHVYWNVSNAANKPLDTLMQGTMVHLWFLVGLLCALSISALLVRYRLQRLLLVVAVVLYCVGLAGKAYQDTPFGFHVDFNFRDGPFFSLIFFVTGYFLQRRQPDAAWLPTGLLIAGCGAALHFTELLMLKGNWGTTMKQDYVLGTYFFGTGMAMIALSDPRYLQIDRLASIGSLVLGIYASHLIFVNLLFPLDRRYSGNAAWDIAYVAIVFLLSYALALAFSKFRLTRRLVA